MWTLRSVKDNAENAKTQEAFGTHATKAADARTAEDPYRSYVQINEKEEPVWTLRSVKENAENAKT